MNPIVTDCASTKLTIFFKMRSTSPESACYGFLQTISVLTNDLIMEKTLF